MRSILIRSVTGEARGTYPQRQIGALPPPSTTTNSWPPVSLHRVGSRPASAPPPLPTAGPLDRWTARMHRTEEKGVFIILVYNFVILPRGAL